MSGTMLDSFALPDLLAAGGKTCCVGEILQLTAEGQALVDYPGNPGGPVAARSVVSAPPAEGGRLEGMRVLLLFENGDAARPIIVGIVRDAFCPLPLPEEPAPAVAKRREAVVDGKRMVVEARDEIVLCCGKSSLTLKKDGTIILKGTYLVSRSSGVNKIKGATVTIN
jgi:hypothetical protein